MTGIIDVGGGLRGIYGAGIFDRCLDEKISFDYCIGVSAGSANIASFLANQRGRNYLFYREYSARKEYMSLSSFLRTGSFLSVEYVYGTLSNESGENPLDLKRMTENSAIFKVVATDAHTGKSVYLDKTDFFKDDFFPLKASSSLPVVCRPFVRGENIYYDGGIADGIPLEKAFVDGCEKVVLILTHPLDYTRRLSPDLKIAERLLRGKFPETSKAIREIPESYNDTVKKALKYRDEGKLLILAPKHCCGIKTLTKDKEKLHALYQMGYEDAKAIQNFIE